MRRRSPLVVCFIGVFGVGTCKVISIVIVVSKVEKRERKREHPP
jgi:hypothetical protein